MKKIELTYDQGQERQRRWRELYAKEIGEDPDGIDDKDLLNWLSMNFRVVRKVVSKEEI